MTLLVPFKWSRAAGFWVLAAGSIFFAAGFYILALKPGEGKLADLEKEYQAMRRPPAAAGFDDEPKRYYAKIPEWRDFTRVMGEVYSRAEGLGLLVESATYRSETVKGADLTRITASMPVTGSYGNIKRFIYELEASPRLFIIEGLSLGGGKPEGGEVSLKLTVTMHFKG